jgi:hypothetical protein
MAIHFHSPLRANSLPASRLRPPDTSTEDRPYPNPISCKPRACGHAACLPARMGRGGKSGIVALARASGRSPPHGGGYFCFGNERAKPLAFPSIRRRRRSASPSRHAAQATAPLHRATPAGRPAPGPVGQWASGKERGKSASGSAQKRRTLRSAKRGKERVLSPSRSFAPAPDRYPNGPGLQARSATADRAGRPKGSAGHLCKLSSSPHGSVSVWMVAWWMLNRSSSISVRARRVASALLPSAMATWAVRLASSPATDQR